MSFYASVKLKREINEHYLALYKHQEDLIKLEEERKSDPKATVRNNEIKMEISEHKDHCKRLLKTITELEEKL